MGCMCSKIKVDDMKSSESTRELDPELKAQIREALSRIPSASDQDLFSFYDSLGEVIASLFKVNEAAIKCIGKSKKDIQKNQQLFDLVEEYFVNSLKNIDVCSKLEECLEEAHNDLNTRFEKFNDEASLDVFRNTGKGKRKTKRRKHIRIVSLYRKFENFDDPCKLKIKSFDDPFKPEFLSSFQSVLHQQDAILQKLRDRKRKLDKKLKYVKIWWKVWNVIFTVISVAVAIFAVVVASIAAPPLLTALAAAAAAPLGPLGKWVDSLWQEYENEVKHERDITSKLEGRTILTLNDLKSINALISKLKVDIEELCKYGDLALQNKVSVRRAGDKMKMKMNGFMENIKVQIKLLDGAADKYSKDIGRKAND